LKETFSLSSKQSHDPVRVLIVDDSLQVLQDLRQLLELSGSVEIIGEAMDGLNAVHLAAELSPDVVVIDLEMPGMDGHAATRQIKTHQPAPRVVILSVHAGPEEVAQARAAGADSFVIKGDRYEVLLGAILAKDGAPGELIPGKGV
jgi:DNA-binding NarL/FixJ family response regulator